MKSKKFFTALNIALIVLSVIVITIGGFGIFSVLGKSNVNEVENSDSLKNEYYIIGRNPTEYQKENFISLTKELEKSPRDDEIIADLVVRAFIIDFFTWSNKKGAWDVGGQQYVYNYGMFYKMAVDSYYSEIDMFINKYGVENLPTVSNVETEHKEFREATIDGVTYEKTYYVDAKWEYEDNSVLDTSEFQTQAYFDVIIHEDGKYEILWFYDQW